MSHIRSDLLNQAIERLAQLPAEEQDRCAIEILANLFSEQEWVILVASEPYQKWLDAQAGQIDPAAARSVA